MGDQVVNNKTFFFFFHTKKHCLNHNSVYGNTNIFPGEQNTSIHQNVVVLRKSSFLLTFMFLSSKHTYIHILILQFWAHKTIANFIRFTRKTIFFLKNYSIKSNSILHEIYIIFSNTTSAIVINKDRMKL